MEDIDANYLDSILKDSDSQKIYNEFKTTVDNNDYKKNCDTIFNSANENTELKELCYKHERNLKELAKIKDVVQRRDRCFLSMCWIFDEIGKIITSKFNNINKSDILKKFQEVEELIVNDTKSTFMCPSYFSHHDLEERKRVKYLHDYIKNYEQIITNIRSDSSKCETHRKYVQFINTLYKKHKEECCSNWNTECHKYFSCDPFYDPNKLLFELGSCKNGKFNRMSSAEAKSGSTDSTEAFNMEIKNVRCVAHKYKDYGFLSCFDSPTIHNVTIKGNEKITWKTEPGKYIPSRSRGLEFYTRSSMGIPTKLYPIEKDKGKKNYQIKTTDVILGMKNSKCNITREDKAKGIVELNCREISSSQNANIVDGQKGAGKEVSKGMSTEGKLDISEGTPIPKGLKDSTGEACSKDILGFCVDNHITHKNKEREEEMDYIGSYVENENFYDSNTSYFNNSDMENSISNSIYTKIGLVSALVLGSFLVFFMYYKYTPVGLWIGRKRVKKRTNNYNYQEEFEREISKHRQGDRNINAQKKRVRIAYNPV
ncbi:PIR protein [Plasmodium vivax]|uniref:VIR protein n=1 Tax=Plasmodium vivax TaxID=5855 RepID=A0A564ZWY4_PLAVI|nr:PIR protein [Plasmodium vivax]